MSTVKLGPPRAATVGDTTARPWPALKRIERPKLSSSAKSAMYVCAAAGDDAAIRRASTSTTAARTLMVKASRAKRARKGRAPAIDGFMLGLAAESGQD